uniref:hypothetical protein n=1 Tax=Cupriavidus necator TaxID=106590 RepID=UPI00339DA571
IADGEIVAYRINDRYPHLQFADGKWAAYSTGFALVRHQLALPPAPNSTGPQPADERQDVYSLYLHMADWSTYLGDAMNKIREGNTSGGVVLDGLTNRRSDEVDLFIYGAYKINGAPLPSR